MILFPIRIFAIGSSRSTFLFATYLVFLNCVVHSTQPKWYYSVLLYTCLVYLLSPSSAYEDIGTIFIIQLFYLSSNLIAKEQQQGLQRMYKNQSLYMSSIYHEIKTPMNGIVCANELLLTEVQKLVLIVGNNMHFNAIYEWLEVIRTSSISLNEMIENMLSFSKLQSNIELQLKPVHVKEVLESLKQLILTYPKSPKVQLAFLGRQDLWVMGSQVALHQVLLNICTNALKFTKEGSVRVSCRQNTLTHYVEFQIEDTGIGMTQSFIEKGLFDPFEQEEKPLIGAQRGVGLGMAISKQLIEKMNGKISVASIRGKGTIFIVNLPEAPAQKSEDVIIETENANCYRILNSLIVDDNSTNRRVMSQLLKVLGFRSVTASSGEEAIEICKTMEGNLDVIFMDIFMPGIGGIEAAKRIQLITNKWKKPPLMVGCTADTNTSTIQSCVDSGITTFLHKPIDKKLLKEIFLHLQTET